MAEEKQDLNAIVLEQVGLSFDGDTGDDPAADVESTEREARSTEQGDAPQQAESGPADDDDWFTLPEEAAPEPDHPFGDAFKWEELPDDPAVQKLAKGLQGSYTRKQMELAEERKRIEAERQELARYREYEARKRQDPAAAAQMLQAELEALGAGRSWLGGDRAGGQRLAASDPLAQVGSLLEQVQPENDNEGVLKAVGQQLFQQLLSVQQQQQLFQQQQLQERQRQEQTEAARQVQADISDVEALVKRKLTDAELSRIAAYATENGIPRFNLAFRLMYQDQFLKAAEQRGAKRAEQTLSRKSLQSAMPPGAPPRADSGEPRPPKDIRGNVNAALDEAGIR
jgi:hypothetical protein